MRKVDVVIGLHYGDEGKGRTTNYLVKNSDSYPGVVRFNGGAQAGHTVETKTQRHVFHHLGSGSLVGAPTILSRFFVVNPTLFMLERVKFDRNLRVYVDPDCYVTTPYDILINRRRERIKKHGSCGVGFAETIKRNLNGPKLTVADLQEEEKARTIVKDIRESYFHPIMKELNGFREDLTEAFFDEAEERFFQDVTNFKKLVTIVKDTQMISKFDHLVFEGAQGLRLDQYSEDFPHVTYSSTGSENVAELLKDIEADITVHYVTRTYLTRHGAGPLPGEIPNPGIKDKTNVHNQYQEHLRFAPINFDRTKADVAKDKLFWEGRKVKYLGVVTWADESYLFNPSLFKTTLNIAKALGGADLILMPDIGKE